MLNNCKRPIGNNAIISYWAVLFTQNTWDINSTRHKIEKNIHNKNHHCGFQILGYNLTCQTYYLRYKQTKKLKSSYYKLVNTF